MAFMTSRYRDLKNSDFNTIGDPLVVKELPGYTQSSPGKGFAQQISSRADDAVRMSRLLILNGGKRTEAGNKFTANLALINQQATLAKVQKKDFDGLGKTALQGAADTGKVIASTLAQVPVAGTGTHFVNGAKIGKEYLEGGGNSIGQVLRAVAGAGGGLQGHERVLSGNPIEINVQSVDSRTDSLVSKYTKKLEDSTQKGTERDSNLRQPYKLKESSDGSSTPLVFKTRLDKQGDQGKFPGGDSDAVDRLNKSDILRAAGFREEDIIPFEFQIFNPSSGGVPRYLYFRAYINDFSDNYSGEWNSTEYIGRAENFYNYTGFSRSISLSFILAAHTKSELLPLYKKLNYLVGSTAPSYDTNLTFMRGVFTKFTVGDYLIQVPGFFTNVDVSWENRYPWEIGLNSDYTSNNSPKLPHLMNIGLSFTPVHDFNPEIERPFITNETFIPFNKGSVEGDGENLPAKRLDESGTERQNTSEGLSSIDQKDMPPLNYPGRFRQSINAASNFIKENSLVDPGSVETVKTVDIDSKSTNTPLDLAIEEIANA